MEFHSTDVIKYDIIVGGWQHNSIIEFNSSKQAS